MKWKIKRIYNNSKLHFGQHGLRAVALLFGQTLLVLLDSLP